MNNNKKPCHPRLLLKEEVLVPLGLTVTDAAKDLGISRKTLSELVNEKMSLSSDMAIRIGKATNTSPESWLGMQAKLDLWNSENKDLNVIPFPIEKVFKPCGKLCEISAKFISKVFYSSYTPVKGNLNYEIFLSELKNLFNKYQENDIVRFNYKIEVYSGKMLK